MGIGDSKGYSVSTYNHASGQERVDIEQKWHSQTPATVAWLSSQPPSKWPAALAFHQGCLLSDLAPTDREGIQPELQPRAVRLKSVWELVCRDSSSSSLALLNTQKNYCGKSGSQIYDDVHLGNQLLTIQQCHKRKEAQSLSLLLKKSNHKLLIESKNDE